MQIARANRSHVCHTLQAYWRDVLLDTGFSIVDRENGLYDVTFTPNIVGEVRLRCGSQVPPSPPVLFGSKLTAVSRFTRVYLNDTDISDSPFTVLWIGRTLANPSPRPSVFESRGGCRTRLELTLPLCAPPTAPCPDNCCGNGICFYDRAGATSSCECQGDVYNQQSCCARTSPLRTSPWPISQAGGLSLCLHRRSIAPDRRDRVLQPGRGRGGAIQCADQHGRHDWHRRLFEGARADRPVWRRCLLRVVERGRAQHLAGVPRPRGDR